MPSLLAGGPTPQFLPGTTQADAGAKNQNLGYPGGSVTGAVGTLDFFFNLSVGNSDYCQAASITVSRKSYTRTRVIGGVTTTVRATSYALKDFPFVDDQTGQAGKEISIIDPASGDSWVLRMRGSMQSLIQAICSGNLEASRAFYIRSLRGRTYGPFVPPGAKP
jgi:hypothetical protein